MLILQTTFVITETTQFYPAPYFSMVTVSYVLVQTISAIPSVLISIDVAPRRYPRGPQCVRNQWWSRMYVVTRCSVNIWSQVGRDISSFCVKGEPMNFCARHRSRSDCTERAV